MLATSSEQREGGLVPRRRVWGSRVSGEGRTHGTVRDAGDHTVEGTLGHRESAALRGTDAGTVASVRVARGQGPPSSGGGARTTRRSRASRVSGRSQGGAPASHGSLTRASRPAGSRVKARGNAALLLRRAAPSKEARAGSGLGPLVGTSHAATAWERFGVPIRAGPLRSRGRSLARCDRGSCRVAEVGRRRRTNEPRRVSSLNLGSAAVPQGVSLA